MARTPLQYLDLDVWFVTRPDGSGYRAYTLAEPHFCLVGDDPARLARDCAAHLGLYAMTDGHAARFRVEPSFLPEGLPLPEAGQYRPPEPGCLPIGRLVVTDVLGADGRSLLPWPALPAGGTPA